MYKILSMATEKADKESKNGNETELKLKMCSSFSIQHRLTWDKY
jgi:hypothetical protein